jgi:enoyl-CoA hydratase/carnithine racemase
VAETGAEEILVRSDAGAVATLTLNDPKRLNALSERMLAALKDALAAIAADAAVQRHGTMPRALP